MKTLLIILGLFLIASCDNGTGLKGDPVNDKQRYQYSDGVLLDTWTGAIRIMEPDLVVLPVTRWITLEEIDEKLDGKDFGVIEY